VVAASRTAVLSIITVGGKWVEMTIFADPLYQHPLLTAEPKFCRCIQGGEPPRLFGIGPPRARIEAVRTVDMSGSNAWAEFANLYRLTRAAALDHDRAEAELHASCRRMRRRRPQDTACGLSAQGPARLALSLWKRRSAMQRRALAAALATAVR
jgi:hypothetical protein